jgi:integrase
MTRLSLAHIVAEELAIVREFSDARSLRGRPRRTKWSETLPGFGIRYYASGRSIYIVQAAMAGVTRTVTLGSTKVLTSREALSVARRVLLRAHVGEDPASDRTRIRQSPSFESFLSIYWNCASHTWKARTRTSQGQYRRKYLDGAFAGKFIDELDQADVLAWFNRVSSTGGPGAGNRCMEILRSMLNHAERWGYRPEGSNPCAFIRPNKRRKCERFLSEHEIGRLGEVLDRKRSKQPLHVIIIYLLLLTGCRRTEITKLTWGEVKGSRLLLHDSKTGARTVWLGDEARMLLSTLERRGPSDPVFWSKLTRRPVLDIETFWRDVKLEAELPGVRLHDLRHSFASHAAARSETLPMIGKLLGHARLQSTSRYAHLDDGHVLEAAERIGKLLAEAMGDTRRLCSNTKCDRRCITHDR